MFIEEEFWKIKKVIFKNWVTVKKILQRSKRLMPLMVLVVVESQQVQNGNC